MIKSIQYFAEADQSRVLAALDLKAAFQNVSRRSMLHSLGQHDPELATVFSRWYTGSTTHRMHHDGSYAHIQSNSGIDQGCPLSPCGFAAAIEAIPRAILAENRSKLDDGAKLWAYLDDWYIWIKPQHITKAIELISTATRKINLELQPTKIQIWTATCHSPIPPAFQDKIKSTLKCLGAHLRTAGDSDGCPVELGGSSSMQTAIQRFRSISTILRELNQAGLKMQTVNDLLTMYVGAASQHALRTTFVPLEEAVSFDKEIVAYWSQLAGRDVSSPLFHLPLRIGGLGVQRHIDTLQHHGRPGTPSSPPYRKPLELRTSTPCSPPHASYEANSTNFKSCYQNKSTPLTSSQIIGSCPPYKWVPKNTG